MSATGSGFEGVMSACSATGSTAGVLTNALELVDCYTDGFVYDVYNDVFGPGTPFADILTTILVLYVAIYGLQLVMGRASLAPSQLGPRILKIGFILALLNGWPTFQRLVVDVAFNGPTGIANEMLTLLATGTSNATNVVSAFDTFYDRMMDAAAAFVGRADVTSLELFVAAGFIWTATTIAMFFAFGFLLVAKLATALILAVGPVFIGLFLFMGSRGLFEGWLRALVTFSLTPLLLLTSLAMLLAITNGTVVTIRTEAITGEVTWDNLVLLLVITGGFALLFLQIPNITASIAGGISIGGVANAMTALGLGGVRAAAVGGTLAAGTGSLAYALRSPASRAMIVPEFQAATRRAIAGLGERARWWNRVAMTPAMRHAQRVDLLRDADKLHPRPSRHLPRPVAAQPSGHRDQGS